VSSEIVVKSTEERQGKAKEVINIINLGFRPFIGGRQAPKEHVPSGFRYSLQADWLDNLA
jgi:hypothetical protein